MQCDWAVITAGKAGAAAADKRDMLSVSGVPHRSTPYPLRGALPFSGGLLYGLVQGWHMHDCLDVAAASGALRCERAHNEPHADAHGASSVHAIPDAKQHLRHKKEARTRNNIADAWFEAGKAATLPCNPRKRRRSNYKHGSEDPDLVHRRHRRRRGPKAQSASPWDGAEYEIDLNAKHSEELRSALGKYVTHARKIGGAARRGTVRGGRQASTVDTVAARKWAREKRYRHQGPWPGSR